MYHEQWKIVIGYDFLDLDVNRRILKQMYEQLSQTCSQNNGTVWACSSKYRINKRLGEIDKLADRVTDILHLAGIRKEIRNKRGLFDFIGEISKTLFGTLSDNDATYYNKELDKLHADQKSIIQYVRNQTSFILRTLNGNKKVLETATNSLKHMNDQFNKVKGLAQTNEANIWIDEILLDLDVELNILTNDITRMTELIFDGRHGIIKPSTITPTELFSLLREHKHVDNFPVPLDETYYTTLIDISEITVVLSDKRLLIQILIPLLEEKVLELTRVISLPRHGWLRQSIVDTTYRLILLDSSRTTFIPISETELNYAKNLGKSKVLRRKHPDYKVGIKDSCLTEIITKRDTDKCTTKYMQIQNTLWIQLNTNKDWIGIAPKEEYLHILCSKLTPHNVKIYQNFVLHLEPECTAVSDTAILRPSNLIDDRIEMHRTIHVIDQIVNETLNKHKLTDIPLDIIQETHIDPEHLHTLGKTLDELDNIAERISQHQRTTTWKEQFMHYLHITGYVALGSVLFVFLYKIGVFSSLINVLKLLIGNCYNNCSFGNKAPTQHVTYTTRTPHANDRVDPNTLRQLLRNKI